MVSGGQLEFGIGAGNNRNSEFEAYGIPFDPRGVRLKRLDEALRLIRRLWTEDNVTFNGRFYCTRDACCEPKPLQRPHPPITGGRPGRAVEGQGDGQKGRPLPLLRHSRGVQAQTGRA